MAPREYLPDFRVPRTNAELAQYCGIDPVLFEAVISDATRERFYVRHEIPKKRRELGTRTVWEVTDDSLKDAHKALARRFDLFARLVERRYPSEFAYGYVRGRGTQKNAERHCGAPLLLRADLKSFFPSIGSGRLARTLVDLGLSTSCAQALARFCTIRDRLALGLPESPLLSNLVCLGLDDDLSALANSVQCVYSRYADDMAFSGKASVPTKTQLTTIVARHGFQLSDSKFRFTKRGQAHYVTGLSISDPTGPHVPRSMKRRLRQELYYARKYGLEEHLGRRGEQAYQVGINRIDGFVRYISGVERRKRQSIRDTWRSILDASSATPSYMPIEGRPLRQLAFVVDESEFTRASSKRYLGLACVTTEELEKIRSTVLAAARDYRADPFATGRPHKVDSQGLHFADLPPTVRDTFAKTLAFQPFRGYAAIAQLPGDAEYASTYMQLFSVLLKRRLQAADRADVTIYVEENSKIGLSKIENAVTETFDLLERTNDRRPFRKPEVVKARKKTNPEVSVPDFLLGTLACYLDLHSGRPELDRLRFERLRDKIRLVLDLDSHQEFSRRNPLLPWSAPHESVNVDRTE